MQGSPAADMFRTPGFLHIRRAVSASRLLSADSEQPTQQRRQDARRADQDYFHGTHLPFGEPTTAYAAQAGKVPGKCRSGTRDDTPDAPHRLQLCVARRCPESACSLPTALQTHPGTGTGGWRAERPGSVRRWHVGTNDRRPTEDVRPRRRMRRAATSAGSIRRRMRRFSRVGAAVSTV